MFNLKSHPHPLDIINKTNLRICRLTPIGGEDKVNEAQTATALAIMAPMSQAASGNTGEASPIIATSLPLGSPTRGDSVSGCTKPTC